MSERLWHLLSGKLDEIAALKAAVDGYAHQVGPQQIEPGGTDHEDRRDDEAEPVVRQVTP